METYCDKLHFQIGTYKRSEEVCNKAWQET